MPIRDAVDLARFLVETTIGFVKFSVARPKTVGGSIAIAAITKHESFQWVQRQKGFRHQSYWLTSSSPPLLQDVAHPAFKSWTGINSVRVTKHVDRHR
jgi:hypothetical protein